MKRIFNLLAGIATVTLFSGCAQTYIAPSGRADLAGITGASYSMQQSFAARPAAGFPAGIAAVRVQAPQYQSYRTQREGGVHGEGRYSVVTVKDVETDADFERLGKLPDVGGIISVSPLLIPAHLGSDQELREAAARLKADMLVLYTFDTTFHQSDLLSAPMRAVTLGIAPTRQIFVHVTASALVIDTRTGFIYAALEANEKRRPLSNVWSSEETVDRARRDAESAAFKGLMGEFEKNWAAIVERAKKGA